MRKPSKIIYTGVIPLKDGGCKELYIFLLHKLKKQSLR
jgi:hypothetical protein